MPYATQQDMLARYGMRKLVALTDINQPMVGEIVTSVLDARLADASAEIDGYLAGRMPVPMANPPEVLKLLCCRLAYYALLGDTAGDVDQADVKAARDYLKAVAKGEISLTTPDQAPAPAGAGSVLFSAGAKDWGREAA